jgi:hypothetical protein
MTHFGNSCRICLDICGERWTQPRWMRFMVVKRLRIYAYARLALQASHCESFLLRLRIGVKRMVDYLW